MCCNSNHQKDMFLCQGKSINNPALWSRKKKITLLEEHLECLEKQVSETKEALEEIKK